MQPSGAIFLRRLGDLVAENAESLANSEVTDNGKLINEMLFGLGNVIGKLRKKRENQ